MILGINIVVASAILLVYGFSTGDSRLVGLSYSTLILGSVITAFSYIYTEPLLEPLLVFTKGLMNGVTAVLEDLDLLDVKPSIVKTENGYYLVYARSTSDKIDPGIGVVHGAPYLAIPLETWRGAPVLESLSQNSLEDALSSILVEQLRLCKSVSVEVAGNFVKTTLVGIDKRVKELAGYPVNPLAITIALLIAQVANATRISLVEKGVLPDGEYYVYVVESVAG